MGTPFSGERAQYDILCINKDKSLLESAQRCTARLVSQLFHFFSFYRNAAMETTGKYPKSHHYVLIDIPANIHLVLTKAGLILYQAQHFGS